MLEVNEMDPCDRPREKLQTKGLSSLSDLELIALAIRKGSRSKGVMKLSAEILDNFNTFGSTINLERLLKIDGVGFASASSLIATFEFAKRRLKPSGLPIKDAEDAYKLVSYLSNNKQEHFVCISLNGEHVPIAVRIVTVGLLNRTQVHPREVFSDPLIDRAAAVIVAHNHPSGSLRPSNADIDVTNNLKEAGKIIGIPLLDHIIFSTQGFVSLKEEGLV